MNLQTKVILTAVEGKDVGKSFEFTEPDNFLLGRDAEGSYANFRLSPEDRYVSRNHFFLEINPPDCYLRDAGSLNGTFLIRDRTRTVFFLEGRREIIDWVGTAEYLMRLYQCDSYKKVEERIELEDKDLIKVGNTVIQVSIVQQISETPEEAEVFPCIRCGKEIRIRAEEAKKLTSDDFLCEECRKERYEGPAFEGIKCWDCGKDLSSLANSDGRADELKDIAIYWCEGCASRRQDKVPISQIGDYRILRELGSGGFGVVYLARHEKTGRIVALKLTKEKIKKDKRLLLRFKREIEIMKALNHPNLVRLYDDGISGEEENYYFVSEYLPEGSLADLFNRQQVGTSYKEIVRLIVQAMEGLSYFHEKGYVHRDLKPENILIRRDREGHLVAKVGDFGLARSYAFHGGTITKKGEWAGTVFYCPPEQIFNFKGVRPCSDVYAMGMTLYYLLANGFPYDFPRSRKDLLDAISKGKKPRDPVDIILGDDKPIPIEKRRPDIPPGLAEAINKAIEKDASKRFASVGALKEAIERYMV